MEFVGTILAVLIGAFLAFMLLLAWRIRDKPKPRSGGKGWLLWILVVLGAMLMMRVCGFNGGGTHVPFPDF